MVRTWAEKEMRNLKRLIVHNIPCPKPYLLKAHILIMDFIGHNGWCAPRLKEVTNLTNIQWYECYLDICIYIRRMYHDCNLVHGDLSEYNILYLHNKVYIIDVSQSVEHTHPYARELLHKDIQNISDFFRKKGIGSILSNYQLFQFVTIRDLNTLPVAASTSTSSCVTSVYEESMSDLNLSLTNATATNTILNANSNTNSDMNTTTLSSSDVSSDSTVTTPVTEEVGVAGQVDPKESQRLHDLARVILLGYIEYITANPTSDPSSSSIASLSTASLSTISLSTGTGTGSSTIELKSRTTTGGGSRSKSKHHRESDLTKPPHNNNTMQSILEGDVEEEDGSVDDDSEVYNSNYDPDAADDDEYYSDTNDNNADDEGEDDEEEEKRLQDEQVFIQSYVPSSLQEISNPYLEMNRLASGQRESYYSTQLGEMIDGGLTHINTTKTPTSTTASTAATPSSSAALLSSLKPTTPVTPPPVQYVTDEQFPWRPKALTGDKMATGVTFDRSSGQKQVFQFKKFVPATAVEKVEEVVVEASVISTPVLTTDETTAMPTPDSTVNKTVADTPADDSSSSSHSDNENNSNDSDSDDEEGSQDHSYDDNTTDGKYRRILPPHELAEERARAKAARKEDRRVVKEQAALRRQSKVPKHVKKKAIRNNKK